jgi:hypothetical protein
MNPTSLSLLDRLKVARPDASDWNRLQGIYLPLIYDGLGGELVGRGAKPGWSAIPNSVCLLQSRVSGGASR